MALKPEALAGGSYFLPEFPRLVPAARHPRTDEVARLSDAWVDTWLRKCFTTKDDFALFLGNRNGLYGPMAYPLAMNDRIQALTDWWQYATAIDDLCVWEARLGDDHGGLQAMFDDLLSVLNGQDGQWSSPLRLALKDIWRRMSPGLSAVQRGRLVAAVDEALRGHAEEVSVRHIGEMPRLDSYLRIRWDSFNSTMLFLMVEYAQGIDVSTVLDSNGPDFAELHRAAATQMILVNDALSFQKEWEQHDYLNAIAVLCVHEGLGLQESVNRTCELIRAAEEEFLQMRDGLAQKLDGDRDALSYLNGLAHLMGGSREFEYLTPRYHGVGYEWDGSRSGVKTLKVATGT